MATDVRAVLIKLKGENTSKKAFAGLAKSLKAAGKLAAGFAKGTAVAATAAAVALGVLLKRTANAGDRIDKLSKQLSVSAKFLSEFDHAAQLSGTNIETLAKAVGKVGFNALQAEQGSKLAQLAFKDLGVAVHDSNGELKDSEELFKTTLMALGRMENATRRGAIAQTLFGRAGRELLPILADGEEGLKQMLKESKELGFVWSKKTAAAAALFNDSLARVQLIISGVATQLAVSLMPRLTEMIERFSVWFRTNRELIDQDLDVFFRDIGIAIEKTADSIKTLIKGGTLTEWAERTKAGLLGLLAVVNSLAGGLLIASGASILAKGDTRGITFITKGWKMASESVKDYLKSAQEVANLRDRTKASVGIAEQQRKSQPFGFIDEEGNNINRKEAIDQGLLEESKDKGKDVGVQLRMAVKENTDAAFEEVLKEMRSGNTQLAGATLAGGNGI